MERKLTEQALLANLIISQWRGYKYDRTVTAEIETKHEVKEAGNFNKQLITSEELKAVRQAKDKIRDFHLKNTLPWEDGGARLLPASNYFTYVGELGRLRNEYETEVDRFIRDYPRLMDNARIRLNGLFRESEYPKPDQLKDKFSVKIKFDNVPTTTFAIPVGIQHQEQLKRDAEADLTNRIQAAQQENWHRIKAQIDRMSYIFKNEQAPVKGSLFTSLEELITTIPKLNLAEDVALNQACEALSGILVPADSIRKSDTLRSQKAKELEQIEKSFGAYF
ncbi:hypothetical protein CLV58_109230 [Spirosoma oryzae]|uniref:Uncharacterized protein n=1 Tax=Spirosoma oryzae TaxID=1469603 RepID=A0A2T0SYR4_9BACT|nr:hypothetical protein [Spirosoma oryzae]PRY38503.1 hypothetical protein CLV58_109230 [Spirosoma oryzae]